MLLMTCCLICHKQHSSVLLLGVTLDTLPVSTNFSYIYARRSFINIDEGEHKMHKKYEAFLVWILYVSITRTRIKNKNNIPQIQSNIM